MNREVVKLPIFPALLPSIHCVFHATHTAPSPQSTCSTSSLPAISLLHSQVH